MGHVNRIRKDLVKINDAVAQGNALEAARRARELVSTAPDPTIAKRKVRSLLRNLCLDPAACWKPRSEYQIADVARTVEENIKTRGYKPVHKVK